jgi:hypothetical protein
MVNGNLIENRPALHDYLNNAASDSWRVVGMSDQTILLEKQPEE